MSSIDTSLDVLLIADDAYRVAMLRQCMHECDLTCTIRRFSPGKKASAYLGRRQPYQESPRPDLVMFDLAEVNSLTLGVLRDVAFGEKRSDVPVVLLTSPVTETLLDSGEIDGGEATMFSPRRLPTFLRKLTGQSRASFLRALNTLYEYGPILARQPTHFLKREEELVKLSA